MSRFKLHTIFKVNFRCQLRNFALNFLELSSLIGCNSARLANKRGKITKYGATFLTWYLKLTFVNN